MRDILLEWRINLFVIEFFRLDALYKIADMFDRWNLFIGILEAGASTHSDCAKPLIREIGGTTASGFYE